MILFSRLSVSQDGKTLVIKADIEDLTYYDNMYITKVVIDNQKTFSASGPSANPIFSYTYTKESATPEGYKTTITGVLLRGIEMTLSYNQLGETADLNSDLLFVYVLVGGTPASDTPCGLDKTYELGVVYNSYPQYLNGMAALQEFNKTCCIPKELINYMLLERAFKLCLNVEDYTTAINYWTKYISGDYTVTNLITCNCNG